PRGARARFDQRDHRTGVSADGGREAAGLDEDLAPLADAHHRAIHAGEHLEHARQAADVLFLTATLGEIAFTASESDDLPVVYQHQHVPLEPAIAAVAVTPARLEVRC